MSELLQAMDYTYREHRRDHGLDVRLNLALGRSFGAEDYLLAQRARTRVIRNFEAALEGVDMILTPSTAVAANLTGLPAVSFPVGYTAKGLPIGMQAMGRPWEEHVLLRLASNAERAVERTKPQVHFKIL